MTQEALTLTFDMPICTVLPYVEAILRDLLLTIGNTVVSKVSPGSLYLMLIRCFISLRLCLMRLCLRLTDKVVLLRHDDREIYRKPT